MNDRLTGRSLGLLVIFAIAAYLCWLMLRPFMGVLMWAVVLVVVFYPAHRRLEAWTGSPGPAAALSTLLVVFTMFYFFRDARPLRHALYDIVPSNTSSRTTSSSARAR